MRTYRGTSNYSSYPMTVSQLACESCGKTLYACNDVRRRPLQTLKARWLLIIKDKVCHTSDCPLKGMRVRPSEEADLPMVKRKAYGLDVVALIGHQRLLGHKSLPQVHASLRDEFGVEISERHVSNLFKVFLALVHCIDGDDGPLRQQLVRQGRLVLAIDAVHFDDTSPGLFVVRDTISKRVLYAIRAPKKDAASLAEILRKVQAIGIPVIGVVSDKEQSQVLAVRDVFPGVPHQYCQTHFLKNVAKHMDPDLSVLSEAVKEAAQSLRRVEKALPLKVDDPNAQAEVDLARRLCEAGRRASKVSGDTLLDPTPLKRAERLNAVEDTANEAVSAMRGKRKGKAASSHPYLDPVIAAFAVLRYQVGLLHRLRRQVGMVHRLAHILGLDSRASQIKRMFTTQLNRWLKSASARTVDNLEGAFIGHLVAVAGRYSDGLFQCYDVPDLPRNNNDLEREFSRFKRSERKATGRKSTAGGPVETCAEFMVEAWDSIIAMPDLEAYLRNVSQKDLEKALDEMANLSEEARRKRSINRDPEKFLSDALEAWLKA